ncbi:MAG: ABC transporter permease [Armatimonadota bacterium]|nr:ABC transporter permease [Armatimonadota bacterium]MDR5696645.1 ABC transporter permease [Armatimonadota bacterium]
MMWRFLVGKGAQYALVLLVASTINFALPRLMPGSPLVLLAGEDAASLSAEDRQNLLASLGLDRPVWQQYLHYLGRLAVGDLGYSLQQGRPVAHILAERLPWTLLLVGTALVLSTVLGVWLGAIAAWRRGRATDLGLLGGCMLFESMPSFWLAMILIATVAAKLRWFPIFGARTIGSGLEGLALVGNVAWHLVLPLTTLVVVSVPNVFLVMRYSMLSVLGEPYIVTARSKGLPERVILFRHVTRNALLPVATVFMLNLGFVVGGATVIETVFSYPGVGRLLFEAVLARDYPVLQASFFVITVSVIAANVLADLLYPLVDPRVRRGLGV